ncbi:site-specific integrase [Clostridium botulinum]|nr:site-specific integrase [Clostridium botulinum]
MARTTYKKRIIDDVEYYYEVIELPRKSNGKRNRKHICAKTVGELKIKLENIKNDIYNGVNVSNNASFGVLLNEWLYNVHLKDKKPSTINRYEGLYNLYVKNSSLKNKKVNNLKVIDIQKFYNSLELEGISANTITMVHRIIKPFSNYLYINSLTIKDLGAAGMLKLPKIIKNNTAMTVLTVEEQEKFIKSLDNNSDRMLYLFALGTGLRLGELLALTWNDIHDGIVKVHKNIKNVKINNKWTIILQDTPKTDKSNRCVPIPKNILIELQKHKEKQNELKFKAENLYNDNNTIFCTDFGKYIDPSNLNRRFKKSLFKANINPIKFHSLRHTYATRLFENNVPPKVVSDLLGHKDIATTLNLYTWVLESQKNKAIDILDNIFNINN